MGRSDLLSSLTIRDQAQLAELSLEGYSALTTIRIKNTPGVPKNLPGGRLR